jgi:hypothetical protein
MAWRAYQTSKNLKSLFRGAWFYASKVHWKRDFLHAAGAPNQTLSAEGKFFVSSEKA